MRHVDDRDAVSGEIPHHLEEHGHLSGRQGRSGLVHQEHARVVHQRPRDLDDLLMAQRERAEMGAGRDRLVADERQRPARGALLRGPVDGAPTRPSFATDEQVLRYGELGKELQLLVNHPHAQAGCVTRRREHDVAPIDAQATGRGPLDAREDLQERRLSGAVLADQCVNPAGLEAEVDACQRDRTRVRLADLTRLEQRWTGRRHFDAPRTVI